MKSIIKKRNAMLVKYNASSFEEIKEIGDGNFAVARLFYHKQLKQYVVGKSFKVVGYEKGKRRQFLDAEREAKILCRMNHKNIVSVLGTFESKDIGFTIVLEYASCGDLETLLMNDTNIPLPWSIRARVFTELARALDYLHNKHNHDRKRSFQHGDLKPQNVLLGDQLTVKLADFGAATFANVTSATSLSITDSTNTQHTQYYTAPEYLENPNMHKTCSMDVYSYGMVGYEIITRKQVFSGCLVKQDLLIDLISTRGQKPDQSYIDEEANTLKRNSRDFVIFHELENIVYQCWETKAEDRPKISVVKKRLNDLVHNEQIFGMKTNLQVESLIARRKLNTSLSECQIPTTKKLNTCAVQWLALCIAVTTFFSIASPPFYLHDILAVVTNLQLSKQNTAAVVFLAVDRNSLSKYEWDHTGNKKKNQYFNFAAFSIL